MGKSPLSSSNPAPALVVHLQTEHLIFTCTPGALLCISEPFAVSQRTILLIQAELPKHRPRSCFEGPYTLIPHHSVGFYLEREDEMRHLRTRSVNLQRPKWPPALPLTDLLWIRATSLLAYLIASLYLKAKEENKPLPKEEAILALNKRNVVILQ